MATTAAHSTGTKAEGSPWRGFRPGMWQKQIDVRDFIQQNYEPYEGNEAFLASATQRTEELWDKLEQLFVVERKKGVLDVSQIPSSITAHGAGYIDRQNEVIVGLQTEAPLKRAIMPNGGLPHGAGGAQDVRLRARPEGRRGLHEVPQDPQRRRLRRVHRRHPEVPQLAHPDRAARRLRPRPHHRGLPARGALWSRAASRAQAEREGRARRRDVHGRDHPRPRGALRADPRPQGAAGDGRPLRLQHLGSGRERQGSGPVAVLRLPRGGEGAERRRDVARKNIDLPRRLLRARPRGGCPQRVAGPGDHRRLRDQAAHRALPAHAGVRRAVRRRPDLGHRVDRGHGRRRPTARDEDELPLPADALQPRPGAGAEPDDLVLAAAAGGFPALRGQGGDRHELDPVRERRDHAPRLGRRRRHRLLRVADAGGQADAVLRRPRQPRQVPAVRDQRRARRGERRAGGAEARGGGGRDARLRRRRRAASRR